MSNHPVASMVQTYLNLYALTLLLASLSSTSTVAKRSGPQRLERDFTWTDYTTLTVTSTVPPDVVNSKIASGSLSGYGVQYTKDPGHTTTFVAASAVTTHTGDKLPDSVILAGLVPSTLGQWSMT